MSAEPLRPILCLLAGVVGDDEVGVAGLLTLDGNTGAHDASNAEAFGPIPHPLARRGDTDTVGSPSWRHAATAPPAQDQNVTLTSETGRIQGVTASLDGQ